jgi:septum formation protein
MQPINLVLASSSKPRQLLLQRLLIPFTIAAPNVDETAQANETPQQLVQRLAVTKARAVADDFPGSLIIGADQVAVVDNEIFGKPLTLANAAKQLLAVSGKAMKFYIGMCVLDTRDQSEQITLEEFTVSYRSLTIEQIEKYLQKEQPLACAGSCQADGLGITLIKEFQGEDFTALIGLPLLRLTSMLTAAGVDLF